MQSAPLVAIEACFHGSHDLGKRIEALSYLALDERDEFVPETRDVARRKIPRIRQRERHRVCLRGARTLHQPVQARATSPENRVEVPKLGLTQLVLAKLRVELLGRRMRPNERALPPI